MAVDAGFEPASLSTVHLASESLTVRISTKICSLGKSNPYRGIESPTCLPVTPRERVLHTRFELMLQVSETYVLGQTTLMECGGNKRNRTSVNGYLPTRQCLETAVIPLYHIPEGNRRNRTFFYRLCRPSHCHSVILP